MAKTPVKTDADSQLLATLANERANSLGFDQDATLTKAREKALNYYKGKMDDVSHLDGRSSAVSTDVSDAIETILPDLVEIFTAEDVAAFMPRGEEDEDAAEQETDYINHVFFNENDGFMILYTAIKDALLTKTGIFKWWSEEIDESEDFTGKAEEEAVAALEANPDGMTDQKRAEDGTWSFTIRKKGKRARVAAVAPEDFTVSRDTISLRDTPYCAHRARKRVYELLAEGYPRAKIEKFQSYGLQDGEIERARDTAGEDDEGTGGTGDRRLVEVVEHYLKTEKGYTRALTDASESVLLEREEVKSNRFSAITPYITTHRFYGESVADRLLEIQKIRTAITRMALDAGYFALNGRSYIDMTKVNEWTIPDYLNNAPNMPIRGNGPDAVTPLASAGLGFDPFGALEYFSTQAEQRTGIVRNAQGLNPDTLHDTAKGALAMMDTAQKRIRLIARILAETGVKDMFLGLHALIRENSSGPSMARLRNKWVKIDPTSWGSRSDMTIEIGVGASGKEAQMLMLQQGLQVQETIVAAQGGASGPLVKPANVYNLTKKFFEKGLGFKNADLYLTDPNAPPKPGDPPPEPPAPDPKLVEAEGKMAMAQAEFEGRQALAAQELEGKMMLAQADQQMRAQEMAARLDMEREKNLAKAEDDRAAAELNAQLKRDEAAASIQAKRDQVAGELQLKREQIDAELLLKREQIAAEIELKRQGIIVDAQVSTATADVETGGAGG